MKTLDLSAVTPSVGIIPQKDTVEHITSSYLEGVASLAKSMIPTSWLTGKLVILHGCVDSGTPPARNLSAGAVFYNSEVYQVPAASFTTTGLQIGIWTLQDANTGTESKLTDGSDVHVLVDNKFVFAAGLAGSGDFDETSVNVFEPIPKIITIEIGTWNMITNSSKVVDMSTYVDDVYDISSIDCIIFNHVTGSMRKLEKINSTTFVLEGAIDFISGTTKEVTLYRKTGGAFDDAGYNDSNNRGWVTITLK